MLFATENQIRIRKLPVNAGKSQQCFANSLVRLQKTKNANNDCCIIEWKNRKACQFPASLFLIDVRNLHAVRNFTNGQLVTGLFYQTNHVIAVHDSALAVLQ